MLGFSACRQETTKAQRNFAQRHKVGVVGFVEGIEHCTITRAMKHDSRYNTKFENKNEKANSPSGLNFQGLFVKPLIAF